MEKNKQPLTAGFMNPTGDLPTASLASFTATTNAAKIGVDADVPPESVYCPSTTTSVGNPFAATSGTPRPVALNTPSPPRSRRWRLTRQTARRCSPLHR